MASQPTHKVLPTPPEHSWRVQKGASCHRRRATRAQGVGHHQCERRQLVIPPPQRWNIWNLWAKPLLDKKKVRPGTIKAGLTSITKFLSFIINQTDNNVQDFPSIDDQTLEAVKRVVKRVSAMASSVNSLYGHEKWELVLEEAMNSIDQTNLSSMMNTVPAKKAIQFLKKLSS